MNTNLRAILFGMTVAAVMTVAMNVTAAEPTPVVQLDAVTVNADRANFDADGNLKVVQLDPVFVTAHKAAQ